MKNTQSGENSPPEEISDKNSTISSPPSKSNRPLLWAIFVLLTIVVILLALLFVFSQRKKVVAPLDEKSMNEKNIEKELPPLNASNPTTENKVTSPTAPVNTSQQNNNQLTKPATNPEPKNCKAKKFDGKKYDDGESYTTKDGCETCTCDDGNWDCKIKDSCIILPSDCTHNNRVYHDGEARSAECDQTCTCDKGNWKCVMAPGSSCCKEGDKLYHNGESYPASDGCNTCTCNNGHANCTMMLCLPLP